MPQIRLECSEKLAKALDSAALFQALHQLVVEKAGATLGACKSRIAVVQDVYVADGAPDRDMACLDIGLLSGRTPEVLTEVGTAALSLLQSHVAAAAGQARVETSVRLVDMPPALYFK
jgi:5-carboxymethyl-2-hydroxymuconate isomerase